MTPSTLSHVYNRVMSTDEVARSAYDRATVLYSLTHEQGNMAAIVALSNANKRQRDKILQSHLS